MINRLFARLACALLLYATLATPTLSAQQTDARLDALFTRREVDDPDARRGEALHGHPDAAPRRGGPPGPHVAHALRHQRLGRHERHRGGLQGVDRRRLSLRLPGHPRTAQLGGRLYHEPPPARQVEGRQRRRSDRHLGHHRLDPQEQPHQRPRRDARHFLPRLPRQRRASRAASRAQGDVAAGLDGRHLDGRRLLPSGRLPAVVRHRMGARPRVEAGRHRSAEHHPLGYLRLVSLLSDARRRWRRPPGRTSGRRGSASWRIRATTRCGSSARCSATSRHTNIPTLTVGGWWDQEDGFGPAGVVCRAREAATPRGSTTW